MNSEEGQREAIREKGAFKQALWEVVFEAESPRGRVFDVTLLWLIIGSVLVVMLESVGALQVEYKTLFLTLEWASSLRM